jgi:hypothetical protein
MQTQTPTPMGRRGEDEEMAPASPQPMAVD